MFSERTLGSRRPPGRTAGGAWSGRLRAIFMVAAATLATVSCDGRMTPFAAPNGFRPDEDLDARVISGNHQVGEPGEWLPEPVILEVRYYTRWHRPLRVSMGQPRLMESPVGPYGAAVTAPAWTDEKGRVAFRLKLGEREGWYRTGASVEIDGRQYPFHSDLDLRLAAVRDTASAER